MKKNFLTVLVITLFAASSVFAAINVSGNVVIGYDVNIDEGNVTTSIYGEDGTETGSTRLNFSIADDSGIWRTTIDGFVFSGTSYATGRNADGSLILAGETSSAGADPTFGNQGYFSKFLNTDGRLMGTLSIDLDKLYNVSTGNNLPIDLGLSVGANTQQTTLRAYTDKSGQHYDRVRTLSQGYYFRVSGGYDKYVQFTFDWDPAVKKDIAVSALITPIDGIKVSADWALKGENRTGNHGMTSTSNEGVFGAAANADVAKLANLDFTFGASVAYRLEYGNKYNVVAAEVYGGSDKITGYAEYAFKRLPGEIRHGLQLGVDFSGLVKNSALDVYFGSRDVVNFRSNWFVGGDLGYTVTNVKFNLGLEYDSSSYSYNFSAKGFHIVPSVSVSF